MKIHELKTWPQYFDAIAEDRKTFEYRVNDSDFKEGDKVELLEYIPETKDYTSRKLSFYIGYVLQIPNSNYVVFSLIKESQAQEQDKERED